MYVKTISEDPRLKAAGLSVPRFANAVLACVKDHAFNVSIYVLYNGAAPKAATTARTVTRTVLGGTVSEKTRDELADGVAALAGGGLKALGGFLEKKFGKRKK